MRHTRPLRAGSSFGAVLVCRVSYAPMNEIGTSLVCEMSSVCRISGSYGPGSSFGVVLVCRVSYSHMNEIGTSLVCGVSAVRRTAPNREGHP